jgi:hypothetical protein
MLNHMVQYGGDGRRDASVLNVSSRCRNAPIEVARATPAVRDRRTDSEKRSREGAANETANCDPSSTDIDLLQYLESHSYEEIAARWHATHKDWIARRLDPVERERMTRERILLNVLRELVEASPDDDPRRKHSADRSLCCARGIPISVRMRSASFTLPCNGRLPHFPELFESRVAQSAKIRRVDLGVPAEHPKVVVDALGIQVVDQATSHGSRQPVAALVDHVQVVLEPDSVTGRGRILQQIRDDASPFFFRAEPPNDHVTAVRHQPLFSLGIARDRVRLASFPRPLEAAAAEMGRVQKRRTTRFRILP